jgi:hypothetical protein
MTRPISNPETAARRAAAAAAFRADLEDPRHGLPSSYRNYNCRCDKCKAGNTKSHFEYMHDPAHPERLVRHRTSIAMSRANLKKTPDA